MRSASTTCATRAAAQAVVQDIRDDGGTRDRGAGRRRRGSRRAAPVPGSRPLARAPERAGQQRRHRRRRRSRVEAMAAARLQRMFATNVVGAFLCAREAIKRMSTKHGGKGGAIVNVSSAAARLGSPGEWVDYAASKGAIDTMTIGLAKELAEEGIRVNCVRPGLRQHRHPRRGRRARPHRAPARRHPDEARRRARGSRARHPLAAFGRGLLLHGGAFSMSRVAVKPSRVFALLGPTASGKSRLAMQLAARASARDRQHRFGAGLPRHGHRHRQAFAPPSARAVPHHLIDLLDPTEAYSAGRFREDAHARRRARSTARDKIPLLVGGTMLYYRALVAGHRRAAAGRCRGIRAQIDARRGAPAAGRRCMPSLRRWIPRPRRGITPNDAQRIQRALEVCRLTGKPLSALQACKARRTAFRAEGLRAGPGDRAGAAPAHRDALRRACCERGLVDELRELRSKYRPERRACRACARSATGRPGASSRAKSRSGAARRRHRRDAPARQAPAHLAAQPARSNLQRCAALARPEPSLRLDAGVAQIALPLALELLLDDRPPAPPAWNRAARTPACPVSAAPRGAPSPRRARG